MVSWVLAEDMRFLSQRQKRLLPWPSKQHEFHVCINISWPHVHPTGTSWSSIGRCCTCTEFVSRLRNPKFREPNYFTTGCKQTCLNFALEGHMTHILPDSVGRQLSHISAYLAVRDTWLPFFWNIFSRMFHITSLCVIDIMTEKLSWHSFILVLLKFCSFFSFLGV